MADRLCDSAALDTESGLEHDDDDDDDDDSSISNWYNESTHNGVDCWLTANLVYSSQRRIHG